MVDINDVLEVCGDLEERLSIETQDNREAIRKHLTLIDSKLKYKIPNFKDGLTWLNVSSQLSFEKELKGKLVVLDFWTYCCINCLHILPDLEALEEAYTVQDGVAIIGVHSAKFENEKLSENISNAVRRYNIHHPVVNDSDAILWATLQISCWPTLVLVGPEGQFLHHFVGEGHRQKLLDFIKVTKEYYTEKGEITDHSLPILLEPQPSTPLYFPGKVCVSADGKTVAVADTGHHRILVLDDKGVVKNVIGGSNHGYKNGSFQEAQFSSPQGVAIDGQCLYIADTDNHTLRKADLTQHIVETLAGTGNQGDDKEGGQTGTQQSLSSPWDLCLGDGLGGGCNEVLYIAMAGTHQIWVYFFTDSQWYKNKKYSAGTCIRFAGSGLEENKNNSYPEKAGFAQPSGLSLSHKLNCLFVADSESSSVRCISLKDGAVKNVAGGDIDPRNLFAYGDVDDKGTKAKLQHPLGVTMVTEDGPLLVADSYNHKIKTVDVPTRMCQTLMGTGKPGANKGGNLLQRELNEPGGICTDMKHKRVYIADTNNHDIKVLEVESQYIYSLPLIFPTEQEVASSNSELSKSVSERSSTMATDGIVVKLVIGLAKGVHLNEEAPNSWKLYSDEEQVQTFLNTRAGKLKGDLSQDLTQMLTQLGDLADLATDVAEVKLQLDLFICEDSGVCKMDKKTLCGKLLKNSANNELVFSVNLS